MRALLALAALTPAFSLAQFGGPGEYPQFRSMSGLPGSGFGVGLNGRVDFNGAMSLSSPIAFSLTDWEWVVGVGNLSADLKPGFPRTDERDLGGNGTGQIMVGIPIKRFADVTVSHMILSNKLDNAQNVLLTPRGQLGALRYAVGVQDVSGQGGWAGEDIDKKVKGNSRSYFAVATWQGPQSLYVSAGFGDTRFKHGFANASYTLAPRVKGVLEHDGFNWNAGLGIDLGSLGQIRRGRTTDATLFVGVLAGRFAYWSVNYKF